MKSLTIAILLSLATSPTFAESFDNEGVVNYDVVDSLFQPRTDQFVLALSPDYSRFTYVASNGTNTANLESLGATLEYGLSKTYGIFFGVNYGTATYSSSQQTYSGFSNFHLAAKGTFDLSTANKLFASINIGVSPSHATDNNRYTGGNTYTPQVAFQHRLDASSLLAVGLSVSYLAPTTFDFGNTSYTVPSGTFASVLFANYEKMLGSTKLGGIFDLQHAYTGTDLATTLNLTAYALFEVAKDFSLAPEMKYSGVTDALLNKNAYKQDEQVDLLVVARLAF